MFMRSSMAYLHVRIAAIWADWHLVDRPFITIGPAVIPAGCAAVSQADRVLQCRGAAAAVRCGAAGAGVGAGPQLPAWTSGCSR
jgi:hypothetical protein